ncbi:Alpha/beta knot methyltransferase [Gorgonomyces haynaldii]|nr:Alpha/beta knot methyltransferase [Gorgonomyces haynaldii]
MQELDLFPTKTTQRHPIIIVATLLDKTANLGGLCRTCEIFKAESLVVNSLRVRDDPLFTSTSVTSSKWQPMEQVAEHELVDYLKQQKQKGYALLGLEQATNSKSLDRCEFPEKVCIVLGRETTGLPPHILDMLDLVIEIPQFGVVRSLNVHVSASLLLWEFVKQKFI